MGSITNPQFVPLWAPIDGRVINLSLRINHFKLISLDKKSIFSINFLLLHGVSSFAQSDSMINLKVRDSLIQQKPVLRIKNLLFLPPWWGMVFYSLNSSGKRLNQTTNNEIVEDYPFFNTGLDNILQYTPAAAVLVLNVGGIKGKNNLKDEALIYAMAMGINAGVVFPLKRLSDWKGLIRVRPILFLRDIHPPICSC